jgi:hypothetical protein
MADPLSDEGFDLLFRGARSHDGYPDRPVGTSDFPCTPGHGGTIFARMPRPTCGESASIG